MLTLVMAMLALLQSPAQRAPAKATIEGVVVRAGSGDPVAGVQITARLVAASEGASVEDTPPVFTDSRGRFALSDLTPGSWRLTAARNGYTKQEYGQRRATGPGLPLVLSASQRISDVRFQLIPASILSGRVVDHLGEPITGLEIQLLKSAYNERGMRTLRPAAQAATDDRGEYRLFWITPGRYYVRINTPWNIGSIHPNAIPPRPYPMTYYPGTTDLSKATVVDVQPGMEMSTLDFVLPLPDFHRVRGRVIDGKTGSPLSTAAIHIKPRDLSEDIEFDSPLMRNYNPASGGFELREVPSGSYWVFAVTQPDLSMAPDAKARDITEILEDTIAKMSNARVAVEVGGADVDNVVITLAPGSSVRGRITVDGQTLSSIKNFQELTVQAIPSSYAFAPSQRPRTLPPTGVFSLENVVPGQYQLGIMSADPNIYLKEARYDSADILRDGWTVSETPAGVLELSISTKGGEIEGTLRNDEDKPVPGVRAVLIPDRARNRVGLYKAEVSDQDGHFTMKGISPGEYKVFAWESSEDFEYFDADFVRQFEQRGKPIRISESEKVSVDLKVIP